MAFGPSFFCAALLLIGTIRNNGPLRNRKGNGEVITSPYSVEFL